MVLWNDLGFAANYEVEADLEYPGDGDWGMRVVDLDSPTSLPTPGPIAIIRPKGGTPWVLSAQFSQWTALYGTPDPDLICMLAQYERAVLVDARDPSIQRTALNYVVSIDASLEEGLLLLCDWTSITAIGIDGIRWQTGHLVRDDLHVIRASRGRIAYRGDDAGIALSGTLDAATGKPID